MHTSKPLCPCPFLYGSKDCLTAQSTKLRKLPFSVRLASGQSIGNLSRPVGYSGASHPHLLAVYDALRRAHNCLTQLHGWQHQTDCNKGCMLASNSLPNMPAWKCRTHTEMLHTQIHTSCKLWQTLLHTKCITGKRITSIALHDANARQESTDGCKCTCF